MDVHIACVCPPKGDDLRHPDGDTVTLRDVLDFHRATTITKAISLVDNDDESSRAAEILATLSEFYVLMGVERWTLRDVSNKPIPVGNSEVRTYLLNRPEVAAIVVEAADDLYNKAILLPLLARASTSSPPSQTTEPTSAKPDGEPPKRPRPSKRSSISTIPTVATATTSSSLDGVSSSSLNSESAA